MVERLLGPLYSVACPEMEDNHSLLLHHALPLEVFDSPRVCGTLNLGSFLHDGPSQVGGRHDARLQLPGQFLVSPHCEPPRAHQAICQRAALSDWSEGGRPDVFGAEVAGMGCGVLKDWDQESGCPQGFGGFQGLEFSSATGPFPGMAIFMDDSTRFVGGLTSTNFIQYFDATQDETFLRGRLFPLLQGISDFYLSYAVLEVASWPSPSLAPRRSAALQVARRSGTRIRTWPMRG